MKRVSVIIAFYNNISWLRLVFMALEKQTFKDFELIIADDGSSSTVVEEVDMLIPQLSFPVKHVWHEDKKWRKNIILNKAVLASESDYLIFLDGDCIPHRKFIEDHYAFKRKKLIIAGRRVQLPLPLSESLSEEQVRLPDFELRIMWKLLLLRLVGKASRIEDSIRIRKVFIRKIIPEKRKGILGCNFSLHKDDLMEVNGFDERYLHPGTGEDSDLEVRLANAGMEIIVKRHLAIVYHKFHQREDLHSAENREIYLENIRQCMTWTPYGIIKDE